MILMAFAPLSEDPTMIGPDDLRRKFVELYSRSDLPENGRMAAFYGFVAEHASQPTREAEALVDKSCSLPLSTT